MQSLSIAASHFLVSCTASPDFETSRLPAEKTLSQEKPAFPTLVPFVLLFSRSGSITPSIASKRRSLSHQRLRHLTTPDAPALYHETVHKKARRGDWRGINVASSAGKAVKSEENAPLGPGAGILAGGGSRIARGSL